MYNNPFATFWKKIYLKWVESNWNHLRKNYVRKSTFASNEIKMIEKNACSKKVWKFYGCCIYTYQTLIKNEKD